MGEAKKNMSSELVYPLFDEQQPEDVVIVGLEEEIQLNSYGDKTMIMTSGWTKGPVAAVLRGGSNAEAVLEILHRTGLREVEIYHREEKIPQLEEVFLSTVVARAHHIFENTNVCWRRDASIYELVKEIGPKYSTLVFGAPLAVSEIRRFYQKIKEIYNGSIVFVRAPLKETEMVEGGELYKWVRNRTFDGGDFSLAGVLHNYKKRRDLKIAVILPTLNEEETVGRVIETALEVKNVGLIDEVILVDSGSSDRTLEIAGSYPIPIYLHQEIRPDLGRYRGKGEAMFKSGFVTDADIIAWVDTDISTITPRFFYGLLGPLLAYPDIQFVKGYFIRPVVVESRGMELGGGRVTEILVRPWINAFVPELSGYIQPLAGTVAIHTKLLRRMRIPTHYGVEIAMLLQAVEQCGLWSTCQVNLGEVIHRSKDVLGLSEMSFEILQVLAELQRGKGISESGNMLRRVFSSGGNFEIGIKRFPTYWREYPNSGNFGEVDRLTCPEPD